MRVRPMLVLQAEYCIRNIVLGICETYRIADTYLMNKLFIRNCILLLLLLLLLSRRETAKIKLI